MVQASHSDTDAGGDVLIVRKPLAKFALRIYGHSVHCDVSYGKMVVGVAYRQIYDSTKLEPVPHYPYERRDSPYYLSHCTIAVGAGCRLTMIYSYPALCTTIRACHLLQSGTVVIAHPARCLTVSHKSAVAPKRFPTVLPTRPSKAAFVRKRTYILSQEQAAQLKRSTGTCVNFRHANHPSLFVDRLRVRPSFSA